MNIDPDAAMLYHDFVMERHRIWERRQEGEPWPWTEDPILRSRKFTNVYRVLDRGSQFLLGVLKDAHGDYSDKMMQAFLYRYTNSPTAWLRFQELLGRPPLREDLTDGTMENLWGLHKKEGGAIFGMAYQMFVGAENKGTDRLTWVLGLTTDYFAGDRLVGDLAEAKNMQARLDLLQELPRCGPFMAMQIITDLGYTDYLKGDEDEMILPGPGAIAGTKLLDPKADPVDVIHWAHELLARDGPVLMEIDRSPSLMDVQNTFCEFSKYARYRGLPPRHNRYKGHPHLGAPDYPNHWRTE